jgi:hypothetical protein
VQSWERVVTLDQARAEATEWLLDDEFTVWEAEMKGLLDAAWDWYYGQDRAWADMTGQFAAVRA